MQVRAHRADRAPYEAERVKHGFALVIRKAHVGDLQRPQRLDVATATLDADIEFADYGRPAPHLVIDEAGKIGDVGTR
jgi:hypothetical protein